MGAAEGEAAAYAVEERCVAGVGLCEGVHCEDGMGWGAG